MTQHPLADALRELEAACNERAMKTPRHIYLAMIDAGLEPSLDRLEDARIEAREALSQYEKSDTYTKQRIAELVAEGDGFWRPCSGCQEGCDGYVSKEDYPYNDTFRCQPGSGCRECGGIGVIWDDTDYEDYARFALGEKSDTDRDQLREAVQQARDYLLEVGNDYPGSSCQKWCTEKATEVWNAVKPWEHCPSTHCERTQECRSVNECAANKRAALASKTAIDPVTVEAREQKKSTKERLARYMDLKAFTARKVGKAQAAKLKDRREIALGRAAAAIRFFSKDENFARLSAIRALGKDQ